MTFLSPDPIASGKPYAVSHVADQAPSGLRDFIGETVFTVTTSTGDRRITGVGTPDGSGVRFHEKDRDNTTKDVRVWTIRCVEDTTFVAESTSAF